jgi:hypothetical protein
LPSGEKPPVGRIEEEDVDECRRCASDLAVDAGDFPGYLGTLVVGQELRLGDALVDGCGFSNFMSSCVAASRSDCGILT